ncbi:MAG: ATP-dependent sacrificial sulfur transferase LarE [Planctomycetaceae bacterium]
MTQTIPPTVADTASRLVDTIRSYGPVAVAYSGGVDSAVVAKAAFEAWGSQAVAVTAVSPSLAGIERTIAREEAERIGIRHIEISTDEFSRDEYRRNAGDRCFYCKDTLYSLAAEKLAELQVVLIVNGANADDLGDHRPGMKAAADHGIRSPLIELNLTKADVRNLARYWDLSVSEKPAAPCLASRIAYGVEVNEERVSRIEQAEAFLRELKGISEFRVRLEANELARIEVPVDDIARICVAATRQALVERFRSLGFRSVTIDLEGFRSGNLNAALSLVQLGAK